MWKRASSLFYYKATTLTEKALSYGQKSKESRQNVVIVNFIA